MFFRISEDERTRVTLVDELAFTGLPVAVMTLTQVIVGAICTWISGSVLVMALTIVAAACNLGKLTLIAVHRASLHDARRHWTTARYELAHVIATVFVGVSTGLLAAAIFRTPFLELHLIATAMIFGYGSGVVTRLAVRPYLSSTALIAAVVPSVVVTASSREPAHIAVAGLFVLFVAAAHGTIGHFYSSTVRHVRLKHHMEDLARRDAMTGLLNRAGLDHQSRIHFGENGARYAVFVFDLDRFKAVNDTYGHRVGDALLSQLGARLLDMETDGLRFARLGGDEFAAVWQGYIDVSALERLAHRLHDTICMPFFLEHSEVKVGVSIGYVTAEGSMDMAERMQAADEAAYRVKRSGGGWQVALRLEPLQSSLFGIP